MKKAAALAALAASLSTFLPFETVTRRQGGLTSPEEP
jgi:hypothetical protein